MIPLDQIVIYSRWFYSMQQSPAWMQGYFIGVFLGAIIMGAVILIDKLRKP